LTANVRTAIRRFSPSRFSGANSATGACTRKPPATQIANCTARASNTDASAASASRKSGPRHRVGHHRRSRIMRYPLTTTSGNTPLNSASGSPSWAQASSAVIAYGSQRGGPPSRSKAHARANQVTSSGTPVPVWSGERSSVVYPSPGDGTSMIATVTPTRAAASHPVARPFATAAVSRISRV
jgi:hypothetical protein